MNAIEEILLEAAKLVKKEASAFYTTRSCNCELKCIWCSPGLALDFCDEDVVPDDKKGEAFFYLDCSICVKGFHHWPTIRKAELATQRDAF